MEYFDSEKIRGIHTEAISLGLDQQRSMLLATLNNQFVSSLRKAQDNSDSSQLYLDLNHMNNDQMILAGEVIPFIHWLNNASHFVSYLPDKREYFRELALEIEKSRLDKKTPPKEVPERIIFDDTSSLVSFNYIPLARKVGESVAKLTVTKYMVGKPAKFQDTEKNIRFFGTGWLIGRAHLITNFHVINGRAEGDGDAAETDLELQAKNTAIQFDFNDHDDEGQLSDVTDLCAYNKALDYAILEVEETGRPPLTISDKKLEFSRYKRIPVNIIQHPGGEPKQIGFRNNLTAHSDDMNITYFTDTNRGSSGSPVCNDKWQVIALHKSSGGNLGSYDYMGKNTAWVNIGTRMSLIIDDLRENYAELWAAIGADVV